MTPPIEDATLVVQWMTTPNVDDAWRNMPADVFYACYRTARVYLKEHEMKADLQATTHAEWCAALGRTKYENAMMAVDQIRTPGGISAVIRDCMTGMHETIDELTAALNSIAQLADTGSALHKATFDATGMGDCPSGWRVAEMMRERALDILDASDSIAQSTKFKVGDRVRIKFGRDRGHYGRIISKGGDDGTYYGLQLEPGSNPVGYSEYELDPT